MKNKKRLIFDLDNTLILWKEEYTKALQKTMKHFDIDYDYRNIDAIIESQEKLHDIMDKKVLLSDINSSCKLKLNMDFINMLLEEQKYMAEKDDKELKDTMEYLSKKYEIVLLTNWFSDTQKGRLKTAGIDKYFMEYYGGELGNIKPDKLSFKRAIGKHDISECVMIGDSDYHDISGAIAIGLDVIQVDLEDKIKDKKSYTVIKSIKELKDIL